MPPKGAIQDGANDAKTPRATPVLDAAAQDQIARDLEKSLRQAEESPDTSPQDKEDLKGELQRLDLRKGFDHAAAETTPAPEAAAAPSRARDPETGRFLTQEQEAKQKAPPKTVTLNYRGRTVEVPIDKAVELAQQGYDYSKKMEGLNRESRDFQDYAAYRAYLEKHPELAATIGSVVDAFENTKKIPRLVLDDGELGGGDQQINPDLAVLRREQERMKAWIEHQTAKKTVDEKMRRMEEAIDKSPVLKALSAASLSRKWPGGKPRDLALEKLVSLAQTDPDADIDMLAAVAATELSEYVETLRADASYVAQKERDMKTFRSESPGGPAPRADAPKKLSGKDLSSGNVAKDVLGFLRRAAGIA